MGFIFNTSILLFLGLLPPARCRLFCGRLVGIINDSLSHVKRDMGTDIESCQLSPLKKKGASVSVRLWLIWQTLFQRSLSHATQLRRICREFSALSSRRLPGSLKRAEAQAATSQSSSLLSFHLTTTAFHDSSPHLLSHCQNISTQFVSNLSSSPFVFIPPL